MIFSYRLANRKETDYEKCEKVYRVNILRLSVIGCLSDNTITDSKLKKSGYPITNSRSRCFSECPQSQFYGTSDCFGSYRWQAPFIGHPEQPQPQEDFPFFLLRTVKNIIRATITARNAQTAIVAIFFVIHAIILKTSFFRLL